MFRKDPLFIPGWIYFFLMFPLASRLPESFGCENGIIENLRESANVLALWRAHPVLCRP